jgi:ubiquinone/menaquinone biosynthesis C-methylase UbiE
MSANSKGMEKTQRRYNRIAPLYDLMEGFSEKFYYSKWRKLLWSKVEGTRIIEVGVGTGKNFPFYPNDGAITAIDLSEKMLKRAQNRASRQNIPVHLYQMDVQNLQFEDNYFDTVVSTFVFCSVPDPIAGLNEVKRVCKIGGKIMLLEHVLSANRIIGWAMNLFNPLVVRIMGANINRRTVENVSKSGLIIEQVTDLSMGIFKLIEARKLQNSDLAHRKVGGSE